MYIWDTLALTDIRSTKGPSGDLKYQFRKSLWNIGCDIMLYLPLLIHCLYSHSVSSSISDILHQSQDVSRDKNKDIEVVKEESWIVCFLSETMIRDVVHTFF